MCLKGYSHNVARCWSPDRWALVGEAGAFVDPLYSPGTDFIAAANKFTVEMIRTDYAIKSGSDEDVGCKDLAEKANHLNVLYRSMWGGCIDLFRRASPVYGHPSAMSTKVFMDNFFYWSFTCHMVHQRLYALSPQDYEPFGAIGSRFLELGDFMQGFLSEWAKMAPEEQRDLSSPYQLVDERRGSRQQRDCHSQAGRRRRGHRRSCDVSTRFGPLGHFVLRS